jgi:hypothetical protein
MLEEDPPRTRKTPAGLGRGKNRKKMLKMNEERKKIRDKKTGFQTGGFTRKSFRRCHTNILSPCK